MSKTVLISIKPKWCDKIASGEKTIEIRKTRPKLETPFKCYIYCTKPSFPHEDFIFTDGGEGEIRGFYGGGKVIGEFVCGEIYDIDAEHVPCLKEAVHGISCDALLSKSCLSAYELLEYLTAPNRQISIEYSRGYGWNISDLKIYDEPKELTEFMRPCHNEGPCALCKYAELDPKNEILNCMKRVERPPQSWQFVEELE